MNLLHTNYTNKTNFYLPQITQIFKIFYSHYYTIRSLASQDVALWIYTDFCLTVFVF